MADYWDAIVSGAGTVLDWFDENEWATDLLGDAIKQWTYDRPEIDYKKLREMAIQEAIINSPDVFTPQGSTRTTVDPETGKRVVTKEYSPEIDQLYQMLVRNAGAPVDTYHAPDAFQPMMGKYINDREEHMGLPKSEYTPWERTGPTGVQGIPLKPGSPYTPQDGGNRPGGGPPNGGIDDREGYDPTGRDRQEGGTHTRDMDRVNDLTGFLDWGRKNYDMNAPDFDLNAAISDYINEMQPTDPSATEQFLTEYGDELLGFAGSLAGGNLTGTIMNKIGDYFISKYWDGTAWQSPADPSTLPEDPLQDFWDEVAQNDPKNWGAEQSPGGPNSRTGPGNGLTSQDWGSGWGGRSGGSGWYVLEGGAPDGGDLRLFCRNGHCKP